MTPDEIKRLIAEAMQAAAGYDHLPEAVQRNLAVSMNLWAVTRVPDLAAQVVRLTEALERAKEWLERLRLHGGDGAFAMSLLVDGKFGPRITETQLIAEISAALEALK